MDIRIDNVEGAVPFRDAVKAVRVRGRKCSRLSLWRWVRANGVPTYRIGNLLLVRVSDLSGYRHGDERK